MPAHAQRPGGRSPRSQRRWPSIAARVGRAQQEGDGDPGEAPAEHDDEREQHVRPLGDQQREQESSAHRQGVPDEGERHEDADQDAGGGAVQDLGRADLGHGYSSPSCGAQVDSRIGGSAAGASATRRGPT